MILGVHYEYIHFWSPHTSQVHFRLFLITWNIPLLRVIICLWSVSQYVYFCCYFRFRCVCFIIFPLAQGHAIPRVHLSCSIWLPWFVSLYTFFKFSALWRRSSVPCESICDDHDINFLAYILCTLHKPCWCYEIWLMWRIIFHRWQIVSYCFHF